MHVCTCVCRCCTPPRGQGAAKITIPPWPYLGISLRVCRGGLVSYAGCKASRVWVCITRLCRMFGTWPSSGCWITSMASSSGCSVTAIRVLISPTGYVGFRGLAWDYNACTACTVDCSIIMCKKNAIKRKKHACIYSDKSACKRCKTCSSTTSCLKDHSTHACSGTPAMQAQPCHAQNPRNKSHIKR